MYHSQCCYSSMSGWSNLAVKQQTGSGTPPPARVPRFILIFPRPTACASIPTPKAQGPGRGGINRSGFAPIPHTLKPDFKLSARAVTNSTLASTLKTVLLRTQLIVQPTRRARGGGAAGACAHPARDGADELGHLAELFGDIGLLEALPSAVQSQPISGSGHEEGNERGLYQHAMRRAISMHEEGDERGLSQRRNPRTDSLRILTRAPACFASAAAMNVTASPLAPARPVRPIRWT